MTTKPDSPTPCPECREGDRIREFFEADEIEAHVTTAPPLVVGPFTMDGLECPVCHRVWWAEPTSEQRATWTRERTP